MSEWTVVTVIVALAGFVIAVVSPIVKLNTAITRINTTITTLEKDIENLTQCNTQGHERIWRSNSEQDKQMAELKIRLAVLEKARK